MGFEQLMVCLIGGVVEAILLIILFLMDKKGKSASVEIASYLDISKKLKTDDRR